MNTTIQFWESLAIILSLVTGAAWAAYTFFSRLQAALEVRIRATQLHTGDAGNSLIQVMVEIENKGTRNTRLEWAEGEAPFRVFSIKDAGGDTKYEEVQSSSVKKSRNPSEPAKAIVIRAGTTERIPFLSELGAGDYLLSFAARLPTRDRRQSARTGTPANRPTVWAGRQFIHVPIDAA